MKMFTEAKHPRSSIATPIFGVRTASKTVLKNHKVVTTILLLYSPFIYSSVVSFANSAYKPSKAPLKSKKKKSFFKNIKRLDPLQAILIKTNSDTAH